MAEVDPPNDKQEAKWKRFEKLVYSIQKDFAGTNAIVKLNDHIMGVDSGTEREIDISIRQQVAQFPLLVIIDCKDYAEPIDVVDMGAFVTLTTDVRANKGVMVSSNRFTSVAIKIAKNAGIDTLLLIDSRSVDWKTYIALPVLIDRTYIEAVSLKVMGVGRSCLPCAVEDLMNLPLYSDDSMLIRTPRSIINKKWNKEQIPHEPGIQHVELGQQFNVEYNGVKSKIDIAAQLIVKREFYLGPLQISTQGFHDQQNNSLITKELRTEAICSGGNAIGNAPGWKTLDPMQVKSAKVFMRFTISDGYGDEDDFEEEGTTSQEKAPE